MTCRSRRWSRCAAGIRSGSGLRAARPPRGRGDGPGVPGPVRGGPPGRGQDDQDRVRRRGRVPGPVRARGGRGPAGQRGVHRGGRRGRPRGRHAVAGHRLRARALAEQAGADVRPAAGAGGPVAGGRVRRGAGVDPQRRAGAPRPEAVQRAGLAGRAPGDRLRGGQGRRADPAHGDPRRRRARPPTWRPSRHGTPGRRRWPATCSRSARRCLYAATGHAPYQGETVMDVLVQLATEPPDLSGLPAGAGPSIVTACLDRSPRQRPTSAALLGQLGPFVAGPGGPRSAHAYLPAPAMAAHQRHTSTAPRASAARPAAEAAGTAGGGHGEPGRRRGATGGGARAPRRQHAAPALTTPRSALRRRPGAARRAGRRTAPPGHPADRRRLRPRASAAPAPRSPWPWRAGPSPPRPGGGRAPDRGSQLAGTGSRASPPPSTPAALRSAAGAAAVGVSAPLPPAHRRS